MKRSKIRGYKSYCSEPLDKIEHYEEALADDFEGWCIHHRLEIQQDKRVYAKELIDQGLYFGRPAEELVFMRREEHTTLHNKGENNPFFGKHHSAESCQKMSKSRKGKHLSAETRKKLSEAKKGKHHSEETRKKMSEAKKGENNPFFGKHRSAETCKKIAEANKGKHRSAETCKKIAESKKGENHPFFGKHRSAETRQKLSEALSGENNPFFGKCHSAETRQKMSEAHKGKLWWNNGISSIRSKECPGEGWTRGRLRFK